MNSKTLFYILKRILLALLTVWIVITITFFATRAIPGDPFAREGKALPPKALAAMQEKFGLNKPAGEQYVDYLKDIVTELDFGMSLKKDGRSVMSIITDGMAVPLSWVWWLRRLHWSSAWCWALWLLCAAIRSWIRSSWSLPRPSFPCLLLL